MEKKKNEMKNRQEIGTQSYSLGSVWPTVTPSLIITHHFSFRQCDKFGVSRAAIRETRIPFYFPPPSPHESMRWPLTRSRPQTFSPTLCSPGR